MVALARSYRKNLKWPVLPSAYFVAPTGSDGAAGSFAAPFLTLAHAQTAMRTGNKITYVRGPATPLTNAGGISSGALSLTVLSAAAFPASGNFTVQIDTEQLLVTAGQGTTTWTVSRAQNSTTAAAHSQGATITYVYAAFATLSMNAAGDTNTSWSNYPGEQPILDGGNSTSVAFILGAGNGGAANSTGVVLNGLTMQNFVNRGVWTWSTVANGPAGHKIWNCTIRGIAPVVGDDDSFPAGIIFYKGTGNEACYNLIYNCGFIGIRMDGSLNGSTLNGSNHTATDNIVHDTGLASTDSGCLYAQSPGGIAQGSFLFLNNVAYNTASNMGIYLDDMQSNTTIFGNLVYGTGAYVTQIHGGSYNCFTNNVFDISSFTRGYFYQVSGSQGSFTAPGNVFKSNIMYSSSAAQPLSGSGGGVSLGDCGLGSLALSLPAAGSNLHYAPNVAAGGDASSGHLTNQMWQTGPNQTDANWDGADITNTNPSFRNAAGNDYALLAGSAAFSLSGKFLPVAPGAGPSLAGLPPIWAAMGNNVIRNSDPRVGSVLAATGGGATTDLTGGTLPTNWSYYNAGGGLSTAVRWIGIRQDGTPAIRIRLFGTSTSTLTGVIFDAGMTLSLTKLYTGYMKFCVCGGTTANVSLIQFVIQDGNSNNLGVGTITPSGIPALTATPTTVLPAVTANGVAYVLLSLASSSAAVDITLEIQAPQLVF